MNDSEMQTAFHMAQPWSSYHRKLVALFGRDPRILVQDLSQTDENAYEIVMQVDDDGKAAALKKLLDPRIEFGGIVLTTTIQGPGENPIASGVDDEALVEAAFAGNPLFVEVVSGEPYPIDAAYCVFAPVVLQFWNDNLNDYQGNVSILPADLAQSVLLTDIHCCTQQL